ncbi:TolC family protein [Telmatocola sphagniphila]|uniref:TolC family protein n=1 Tax=Telmatocola sphagniphila TaxID=1123043 RepID=A0A8E6B930_9BACT|nr:TolC family protein [Telmatocola sphagniphila]QVL33549.1 TolC family protein [Telmatocola sphagniphila]
MNPAPDGLFRIAVFTLALYLSTASFAQDPSRSATKPALLQTSKQDSAQLGKTSLPNLAAGELPIDLATALRLAGSQNPQLILSRERITEATAIQQLTAAQILPNLNLGTNYDLHRGALQQSNGNILNVNRDALYLGLGSGAVGAGTVNIPGLQYNLNVGTAWFDYLRSKQIVARNIALAKSSEQETLLRVSLAYCELLRFEGRLAIAKQNLEDGKELSRLTNAYAQVKQGRKADADRANVELKRRETAVIQTEADAKIASARLCQLLSLDPTTRLKPIDGWVVPEPIVPNPISLQELIAIALLQRPELEARRAEIQEALYALSHAKLLPFSPNVLIGFSAGGFGGGSNLITQGFIGSDGKPQVGPRFGNLESRSDFDAVAYWTLQNLGVGNVAQVHINQSRVRQANLRQIETLNRICTEVAESHARAAARYGALDTTAKAVMAGAEGFREELIRIKGREGLPIEVIDSMRLLGRARLDYLDTIVDYNRAQFELYVALGQPPADRLARPVPSELVPNPNKP